LAREKMIRHCPMEAVREHKFRFDPRRYVNGHAPQMVCRLQVSGQSFDGALRTDAALV
jgi:hypothetical protein